MLTEVEVQVEVILARLGIALVVVVDLRGLALERAGEWESFEVSHLRGG